MTFFPGSFKIGLGISIASFLTIFLLIIRPACRASDKPACQPLGQHAAGRRSRSLRGSAIVLFSLLLVATYAAAEGEVSGLKQFEYWDNGKIRKCTMYDAKGSLKAKAFCRYDGTVEKVESYDREGHKIEEVLYDERGRLKTGIDGWAAARWWYYGSWLVSQITYNEEGKPLERKQYSESGRLILRQYKEQTNDLNPYEAASMAMMLGGRNMRYFGSRAMVNDAVPAIKPACRASDKYTAGKE